MSYIVKGAKPKTIDLQDGFHTGVIKNIQERQVEGKDFSYLDLELSVEEKEIMLKVSYPLPKIEVGLNERQALGKLVQRMTGKPIEVDADYDLEKIFVGRPVQFVTLQNEKGYFDVTKESVKPHNSQDTGNGVSSKPVDVKEVE